MTAADLLTLPPPSARRRKQTPRTLYYHTREHDAGARIAIKRVDQTSEHHERHKTLKDHDDAADFHLVIQAARHQHLDRLPP